MGMDEMNRQALTAATRFGHALRVLRVLALFLALPTLSPAPVPAQEAEGRRIEDVLPPAEAARVRELASEAADAGVPASLVLRKAYEGAAKGYPPRRIVSALEDYSLRLREASGLVGRRQRPETVAAAAEALRRGVPADAIRTLAARTGEGQTTAVPLIVLSDLTEAGVPTENALEMVNLAMDRGTRGDQMLALSAAIRRRMRQGDDWRSAVEAVRLRIERQRMRRDRMSPSSRPTDTPPVPPGSDPPHRQRDGG